MLFDLLHLVAGGRGGILLLWELQWGPKLFVEGDKYVDATPIWKETYERRHDRSCRVIEVLEREIRKERRDASSRRKERRRCRKREEDRRQYFYNEKFDR